MFLQEETLRVAIIDMYNGEPNQGMRCIREILNQYAEYNKIALEFKEFDVRRKLEIPDTSFPIYISTGGPGDPLSSKGLEWDNKYFSLIRQLEEINHSDSPDKKHVFFICHSFQLICRHYSIGKISLRKSPSFGVFPMHKTTDGEQEEFFKGLSNPFYAVDSRHWQVTAPDQKQLEKSGAKILALEKERPHVPLD
ncbi:MAG: GMP synthase, partial [Chitinophagaceae bacterium]